MKYFQARLPLLNGQLEFESVNEAENNKNVLPHSGTTALFAPHNRLVHCEADIFYIRKLGERYIATNINSIATHKPLIRLIFCQNITIMGTYYF